MSGGAAGGWVGGGPDTELCSRLVRWVHVARPRAMGAGPPARASGGARWTTVRAREASGRKRSGCGPERGSLDLEDAEVVCGARHLLDTRDHYHNVPGVHKPVHLHTITPQQQQQQ
jgi:hypothetical protein